MPDGTTLGCISSEVYEKHLHNLVLYECGYRGNHFVLHSAIFGHFAALIAVTCPQNRCKSTFLIRPCPELSAKNYTLWGMGTEGTEPAGTAVFPNTVCNFRGMRPKAA